MPSNPTVTSALYNLHTMIRSSSLGPENRRQASKAPPSIPGPPRVLPFLQKPLAAMASVLLKLTKPKTVVRLVGGWAFQDREIARHESHLRTDEAFLIMISFIGFRRGNAAPIGEERQASIAKKLRKMRKLLDLKEKFRGEEGKEQISYIMGPRESVDETICGHLSPEDNRKLTTPLKKKEQIDVRCTYFGLAASAVFSAVILDPLEFLNGDCGRICFRAYFSVSSRATCFFLIETATSPTYKNVKGMLFLRNQRKLLTKHNFDGARLKQLVRTYNMQQNASTSIKKHFDKEVHLEDASDEEKF
ncbi:hypothetical protein TIFTF001_028059 [Ficus carica]|uniref:Uncharacterized protein n=1 Tax=Ficus carica TaxID=3494 RepID=A0AA88J0M8_FICCA|nr:hypothetical protein TIFTF001_028059 [Ficus carica]